MPTFLSDPSSTFTFLLLLVAVVAVGVWYRYRDKKSRNLMIAVLGSYRGTARDRSGLRKSARTGGTEGSGNGDRGDKQNPDGFLKHVSDSFDAYGANKAQLRKAPAWGLIRQYHAKITAFNFQRNLFKEIGPNEVEVVFTAKATAESGLLMRYCQSRWVKESDGEWRLKSVKFFNPADGGMNKEEPIPGFPN